MPQLAKLGGALGALGAFSTLHTNQFLFLYISLGEATGKAPKAPKAPLEGAQ